MFVKSIAKESSPLSAVYFFGSFGFLIIRTCAVTLLTARIHDQSKVALPYLYNCSTSSYGIEVTIFSRHVLNNKFKIFFRTFWTGFSFIPKVYVTRDELKMHIVCSKAQRLQYQLATDEVALTGLRFFSITRNFMLAVNQCLYAHPNIITKIYGIIYQWKIYCYTGGRSDHNVRSCAFAICRW